MQESHECQSVVMAKLQSGDLLNMGQVLLLEQVIFYVLVKHIKKAGKCLLCYSVPELLLY
jgi:hypothetical protein